MTNTGRHCTCSQHGDYCPQHPACACGCQRHAHRGECIAGKVRCHGCDEYRPARLKRFEELCDDDLERVTIDELRVAYRELRSHHVEETTALWEKIALKPPEDVDVTGDHRLALAILGLGRHFFDEDDGNFIVTAIDALGLTDDHPAALIAFDAWERAGASIENSSSFIRNCESMFTASIDSLREKERKP